jgi:hypothetical protein
MPEIEVECQGCQQRVVRRVAVFRRGYFCERVCLARWERAHPPSATTGDAAALRPELVRAVDRALDAYAHAKLWLAPARHLTFVTPECERFAERTHECVSLARALGFTADAEVMERYGFGASIVHVVVALQRARHLALDTLTPKPEGEAKPSAVPRRFSYTLWRRFAPRNARADREPLVIAPQARARRRDR